MILKIFIGILFFTFLGCSNDTQEDNADGAKTCIYDYYNAQSDCPDGMYCNEKNACEDFPVCDPDADINSCASGCTFTNESVYEVQGTGADCKIVKTDRSACFHQYDTCINNCVYQFYRSELPGGNAIIIHGLQGGISDGWIRNGQGASPDSCDAISVEDKI